MENHPIPQNVTGFQFKLIGDMTLKQFAYLAAGCVIAGIFMFAATGLNFIFIRFPIISISLGMGVGLAFIPIMGRPMDIMITNFVGALLTPNQYIYQKAGGTLYIPTVVKKESPVRATVASAHKPRDLQAFLNRLPQKPKNALDEKEATFMKSLFISQTPPEKIFSAARAQSARMQQPQAIPVAHIAQPIVSPPQQNNTVIQSPPIVISVPQKNAEVLEKTRSLEKELAEAKHKEATQMGRISMEETHRKVMDLEKQLQEALVQKQQLEMQFNEFIKKVGNQMATSTLPMQNTVKTVPKTNAIKQDFPGLPEVPNLITGMIKDSRGNILTNILVEVKDKDGNPIRAFKTNNLGQFASATPLLNGVYVLAFEDPDGKHKFDNLEITVQGEIIQPLQVTSIDAREELRKELFG